MDQVLTRIMEASNATVITAYETKLAGLEKDKARQVEKLAKQVPPKSTFTEKLELALRFLSNPWKLWESGNFNARRLVLKLAFAGPIAYCRNEGARTPQLSLPFKVLGGYLRDEFVYGAAGEN